ncbi:hypothetical protein [Demequina globuliformis]|uniref:hypothetical protein n=1 Tax=Demequina globuliformis TaxID=676202 RepID=UPI000784B904|nr:hypothetical protein [Demequina globuliformis]
MTAAPRWRATRRTAAFAAAVATTALLAACTTSNADGPASSSAAPSSPSTVAPPSPGTEASPTPSAVAASALPDAPFTTPGSTVPGDQPLILPVLAKNAADEATEVKVRLTLLDTTEGTLDELAPYLSDTDLDGLRGWYHPAYVDVDVTVVGDRVPDGFAIADLPAVDGVTDQGGQVSAPTLTGAPEQCVPADTAVLDVTGTAPGCLVIMVNDGATLTGVEYRGTFHGTAADYISDPVLWEIGDEK